MVILVLHVLCLSFAAPFGSCLLLPKTWSFRIWQLSLIANLHAENNTTSQFGNPPGCLQNMVVPNAFSYCSLQYSWLSPCSSWAVLSPLQEVGSAVDITRQKIRNGLSRGGIPTAHQEMIQKPQHSDIGKMQRENIRLLWNAAACVNHWCLVVLEGPNGQMFGQRIFGQGE